MTIKFSSMAIIFAAFVLSVPAILLSLFLDWSYLIEHYDVSDIISGAVILALSIAKKGFF